MARRGRPPLREDVAVDALWRFLELRDADMGITAAETKMRDELHELTSKQAVRKRRTRGAHVMFRGFCACVILAEFSYKIDRN